MNPKEFKEACLLTESNNFEEIIERFNNPKVIRLLHAALGLSTEANEFVDQLKKHLFYGKPLDEVNLLEELGDGNWYESVALDVLEKEYEEVFQVIISKLILRYGSAKFSANKAINRDLDIERSFLENELTNAACYPRHILEKMRALNDISEIQFQTMVRKFHTSTVDHSLEDCLAINTTEVEDNEFEVPTKIGEE